VCKNLEPKILDFFGLRLYRIFPFMGVFFWLEIMVWPIPLAQVLPSPQLIFPFKTWFFGIYLNFQWQKSLQNQYLPHSESSKSY